MSEPTTDDTSERARRWRLVLGEPADSAIGVKLSTTDVNIEKALSSLYDAEDSRKGGLAGSAINVARWLGDIRAYFPSSVVQIMQRDALDRLNLKRMLLEPELLASIQPDVHLVADLLALKSVIPARTRDTARMVVRQVVDELVRKLSNPMRQAVTGALSRAHRNRRPRHNEIDWHRTIRANLKHYQPAQGTIIPSTLVGFGHKRSSSRDIILCVDQSGSMATSVVYAGIFGAVLASIPSVRTHMVVFDTAVVDLTATLDDPIELLFSVQLGGGTDIDRALSYSQSLVRRPTETVMILISDLYEGGNEEEMRKRVASIAGSGVQLIALLALNDDGAPTYDHRNAAEFATMAVPTFACTPDLFPHLMAAAMNRLHIGQWAATQGIPASRSLEK